MQKFYSEQRGISLIFSLIILLVITLIGVSAIQSSQVEEKMASNMYDHERSFQAAEAALREGETWVSGLTSEPAVVASCGTNNCVRAHSPDLYAEDKDATWWQANSKPYAGSSLAQVKTAPRYFVEFSRFVHDSIAKGHGATSGISYYRVIARGTGSTDDAVTILETTFSRRF